MQLGSVRSLNETSPHARYFLWSNEFTVKMQISSALKKPKKQVTAAAHGMMVSCSEHVGVQWILSLWRITSLLDYSRHKSFEFRTALVRGEVLREFLGLWQADYNLQMSYGS